MKEKCPRCGTEFEQVHSTRYECLFNRQLSPEAIRYIRQQYTANLCQACLQTIISKYNSSIFQ